MENSFKRGLSDGIPIALGYLSVSFTFGIAAVAGGVPVYIAILISMTNLTSAGQFAGLNLILSGGALFEMALTQLVINARYALMSLSLTQKFSPSVNRFTRALLAFGNTDEIFAVASSKESDVGAKYFLGLMTLPYFGWALGTALGAVAGNILPASITACLGVAIYGMFIAIIIPPAKKFKPILKVILIAVGLSMILYYLPVFNFISSGFSIIICALIASLYGAVRHPVEDGEDE